MTTTIEDLKRHPMYTPSDLEYFLEKGYSTDEILQFWNRDLALGEEPLHHKPAPRLVEYFTELPKR